MAARVDSLKEGGRARQTSDPHRGADQNVVSRLFQMMNDEALQARLLPQIQKALKLKKDGTTDLTELFQTILSNKDNESRVKEILDREMPEEKSREAVGRKRAQSDAGALKQNADQFQLELSVEAMCDGLETNPYLLQWIEAFLKASGRRIKADGDVHQRVRAVKQAFQMGNGRWDGALVESAKIRIVVASGQAKMREGTLLICGDKGKSRRITAPEALAFCLKGNMTPHFGSHTVNQHVGLLELMIKDLTEHPMRAERLEPHVCGVADQLKLRLLRVGHFEAFELPYMGQAESASLTDLGFYRRRLIIDTSIEAPPTLAKAGVSTAIVIDASKEVKGLANIPSIQQKHAKLAGSLKAVECKILQLKGCIAHLQHYADILRKVDHLWIELDEITEDALRLLQNLTRCITLHIMTSAKTEGLSLEYKWLTKLILKAPKLKDLKISGASFRLASARTKDKWEMPLRSLDISVSLQEKLRESSAKGVLQFTANMRTTPHINLDVRYPSVSMEIMHAPPNIESGTQTAAVRAQAFDKLIEVADDRYHEALATERKTLKLFLEQLGAGGEKRPFLGLYIPTWPQEYNRLLPPLATEFRLRVDRVDQGSSLRPTTWPDDMGELHYRGRFLGSFSDWFGTTDAFVESGIPVLSFTHSQMTSERLKELSTELTGMEGVKELDLSFNRLDTTALPVLEGLVKGTRLLRLDLHGNPLDQIVVHPPDKKPAAAAAAAAAPPPLPERPPQVTRKNRPSIYEYSEHSQEANYGEGNYISLDAAGAPQEEELYGFDITPNGWAEEAGAAQEEGLYDVDVSSILQQEAEIALTAAARALPTDEEGLYDVDINAVLQQKAKVALTAAAGAFPTDEEEETYLSLKELEKAQEAQAPLYAPLEGFQETPGKMISSIPGMRANLKEGAVGRSTVDQERTLAIGEEEAPLPPKRLSLEAQAAQEHEEGSAYESPQELGLSLFLKQIAACDHLVYLDISDCGWNVAMLKVLPHLKHLRELGIGNADCSERDINSMLKALEKTSVKHLYVPVEGALKKRISEWNLRRAREDSALHQSEA